MNIVGSAEKVLAQRAGFPIEERASEALTVLRAAFAEMGLTSEVLFAAARALISGGYGVSESRTIRNAAVALEKAGF